MFKMVLKASPDVWAIESLGNILPIDWGTKLVEALVAVNL